MSTKRGLFVVLVASLVLAAGLAVRVDGTAQALDLPGPDGGGRGPVAYDAGPLGDELQIFQDPTYDAIHPSVAYNSQRDEYLVVWALDRPVNDDIMARRVRHDGTLVGPAFYVVGGAGGLRRFPDVTYNSQADEYLVVWETDWDVRARRVSGTGMVLDTSDRIIAAGTVGVVYYDQPAVAYASSANRYLVVFRQVIVGTGARAIQARAVESNGTLVGTSAFDIRASSATALPQNPDLAYNRTRNEFLVAWDQDVLGDRDVYGRRVKMAGGPGALDSPFPILNFLADDETDPAVAAVPRPVGMGQYLVVGVRSIAGDEEIWARRVAGDGTTQLPFIAVYTYGTSVTRQNPAAAGYEDAERFLTAWTEGGMMFARELLASGALPGQEEYVGTFTSDTVAVASGRHGDYLMVWEVWLGTGGPLEGQLWGTRAYLPIALRNHP
jgi:hypothetical protein